jgi:hypothetical protein
MPQSAFRSTTFLRSIQRVATPLLLLLVLHACKFDPKPRKPYAFFVAGHSYGHPDSARNLMGLYPPFVRELDTIAQWPHMTTGFLTGDVVADPTPARMEAVTSQLSKLPFKVQGIPGNHDVATPEGRKVWEREFGTGNDWLVIGGDLFIRLDVNATGWVVTPDQLKMMKAALDRPIAWRNCFVFVHQVLWWHPDPSHKAHGPHLYPNSEEGRAPQLNFWEEVMPLLQKPNRPVYVFAGDVGVWCKGNEISFHQEGNVRLIASGMGCPTASNYLVAEVDSMAQVHFTLRALQGSPSSMGTLEDHSW